MAKSSTSGRMKAVIKASPGPGLELATVDIPAVGPGEILLRVSAASICGTDLHIYRWDPWSAEHIRPPLVIGHEVCGEVVEVGRDVTTVREGDFVSVESHITCGRCVYCRTGRGHICPNTKIIGIDRNGAFAEYLAIPAENAWINPPDMPVEVAVLQENFGNAVHTAFSVDLRAKKVLITGCGPVGLMTILVAKAIGARAVYATDVVPYRLNLALKMGADLVVNAASQDVVEVIREATEGEGVDVLLEMSGAPNAIVQGFTLLKAGGEVALLGLSSGPIPFDLNEFVIFKGIHIYGIIGRRIWETWYQMRGLIRSGLDPSQVITHCFPLEEFDKAFETMASRQSGKIVLYPDARKARGTSEEKRS